MQRKGEEKLLGWTSRRRLLGADIDFSRQLIILIQKRFFDRPKKRDGN